MLTQAELKERLYYNRETGVFMRKTTSSNAKAGDVAGTRNSNGYLQIWINGKSYKAARLAWLYVYGHFPSGNLDHRDRNRTNDRIDNLRIASPSQNQFNRVANKNNPTGLKGVSWISTRNVFYAQIWVGGKKKHLGEFNTKEEAHAAYCQAANFYHGEFANYG
jgi:HNH endonuclease/AP2 domain